MGKRVTAKATPLPPVVIGPCKATDGADVAEVINELRDRERDALVKHMVNRFLGWRLPDSVCSDTCVSMRPYPHPRYGTNLLNAEEARQMIEYLFLVTPASGLMPLCTCESARQCRGSDWAAKDGMRCSQASGDSNHG